MNRVVRELVTIAKVCLYLCCYVPVVAFSFLYFVIYLCRFVWSNNRTHNKHIKNTKLLFPDLPSAVEINHYVSNNKIVEHFWMNNKLYNESTSVPFSEKELIGKMREELELFFNDHVVFEAILEEDCDLLTITVNNELKYNVSCHLSMLRSIQDNILELTECIASDDSLRILLNYLYFGDTYALQKKREYMNTLYEDNVVSEDKSKLIRWIQLLLELLSISLYLELDSLLFSISGYLHECSNNYNELLKTEVDNMGLENISSRTFNFIQEIQLGHVIAINTPHAIAINSLYALRDEFGDLEIQIDPSVGNNLVSHESASMRIHKMVLMARSEYYRNMFLLHMKESSDKTITLPSCSNARILETYVSYIYSGYVSESFASESIEL
jgi:hypothetical protein